LQSAPGVYAALLPEGERLLEEVLEFARTVSPSLAQELSPRTDKEDWNARCLELGSVWEPDFLLLACGSDGVMRLWGGCVCFPSSWSLAEKLGQPIDVIHGVVPGLNDQIGPQIHHFLTRLKPEVAWLRHNWGLSRSSELNQHPSRHLPRLDVTVRPEEVWFRVEHQALVALPRTGGVLFGIRVTVYSLMELKMDATASQRLAHGLATMPEPVAQYKGLASARLKLLEFLMA